KIYVIHVFHFRAHTAGRLGRGLRRHGPPPAPRGVADPPPATPMPSFSNHPPSTPLAARGRNEGKLSQGAQGGRFLGWSFPTDRAATRGRAPCGPGVGDG